MRQIAEMQNLLDEINTQYSYIQEVAKQEDNTERKNKLTKFLQSKEFSLNKICGLLYDLLDDLNDYCDHTK